TLNDLPKPTAGLRSIDAIGVNRRAFDVINLPSGKMRAADLPTVALAIGTEDECAFARACEYSYFAHWIDLSYLETPVTCFAHSQASTEKLCRKRAVRRPGRGAVPGRQAGLNAFVLGN